MNTLPGFENMHAERTDALAEQQGHDLTLRMRDIPRNVNLATRAIEQHSPLFAGTDASPWVPLFQDPTF